jgi:hypothetical protein
MLSPDEKLAAIQGFLDSSADQANLIFTLSVSIVGASLGLLVQVVLFNRKNEGPVINFVSIWALGVTLTLLAISCLLSYLWQGNIAALRVSMFSAAIDLSKSIARQDVSGLDAYRVLSIAQFSTFFVGVIFAVVFWLRNIFANSLFGN